MSVRIPKFISLHGTASIAEELAPKIARCAINVPTDDGLWWSLTLSFLYPVPRKEKFVSRFRNLFTIGDDHPIATPNYVPKDIDRLFDFLKQYNPFLDRQLCFNNHILKDLLVAFVFKIQRQLKKPDHDIPSRLQIVCQLLKCNIILCYLPPRGGIEVLRFGQGKELLGKILTLYVEYEDSALQEPLFYFGINGEILQQKALTSILHNAGFPHTWIRRTTGCILSSDKNIPLHLVRNEFYEAVKLLYKQSYTLIKLEEAGFVINPFITVGKDCESGFSLATGKNNARAVVHTFYVYLSSDERNSDPQRMKKLKDAFNILIWAKQTTVGLQRKQTSIFIQQLIKFNRFQLTLCAKFCNINSNYFANTNDDENVFFEVSSYKEKLIALMTTYLKYFHFRDHIPIPEIDAQSNLTIKLLKQVIHFEKYTTYFEILDLNAALLFFDNLFFFKYNTIHDDCDLRAYEEVESKYLLYLFTCEVYGFSQLLYPSSTGGENEMSRRKASLTHKSFSYNVHFERRNLFYSLRKFMAHIRNSSINLEKNKRLFSVLTSVPVIRDVIILRTILRYLSNVICSKENQATQIYPYKLEIDLLVTERLLHVLGENLKEDRTTSAGESLKEDPTLGKSLLFSSFVTQVRKEFYEIRDTMVHVNERTNAANRLTVEKSITIIDGAKAELKNFKLQCEEFLEIVELQMKIDVLLRDTSHRKDVLNFCHEAAHKDDPLSDYLTDEIDGEEKVQALDRIQSQLKEQIVIEESEKPEIIKSLRRQLRNNKFFSEHCKTHLEVLISGIQHYIEMKHKMKSAEFHHSISFHIRCIKVLLIYCIETFKPEQSWSSFKTILTNLLNDIEQTSTNFSTQAVSNNSVLEKSRKDLMQLYDKISGNSSLEADIKSRNAENFPNIRKLSRTLTQFRRLTECQKKIIISSVPEQFVRHNEAKNKLLFIHGQLEKGKEVAIEKVMSNIKLLLPSTARKKLKLWCEKNNLSKLCIAKDIKDPFDSLKQIIENDELIRRRDYDNYCSEFGWPTGEYASHLLQRLINGDPFETKTAVLKEQREMHKSFLNNKVILLENLLIKSDSVISEMWLQDGDQKKKKHAEFLIVQKFLRDKKFQAAIEMLFLDILCFRMKAPDLERIWIKTSDLFSGINLRNVLAHQNPLIEELGYMLDPDDLAAEIISKCLQIVEEKNSPQLAAVPENPLNNEPAGSVEDPDNPGTGTDYNCLKTTEKKTLVTLETVSNKNPVEHLSNHYFLTSISVPQLSNLTLKFTLLITILLLCPLTAG